METVAFAVSEHPAVGAYAGFHPLPVAELLVAVFPYIPEIVGVYVALSVVGAYAGTCAYASVDENGTYGDARVAAVEIAPDLAFVVSEETFAAVRWDDATG